MLESHRFSCSHYSDRRTWRIDYKSLQVNNKVLPYTIFTDISSSRTTWVKYNGLLFKQRAGIIINVEDDLPVVGQIEEIYVADKTKIFFRNYLVSYIL